jgi:hypothetical protein
MTMSAVIFIVVAGAMSQFFVFWMCGLCYWFIDCQGPKSMIKWTAINIGVIAIAFAIVFGVQQHLAAWN